MSVMERRWPETGDALRCARCGQPHLPAEGADRFVCGNCGRPLVSRSPGKPGAEARRSLWIGRGALLLVTVAVAALLVKIAPGRGQSRRSSGSEPLSVGAPTPGGGSLASFWMPVGRPEETIPLPDLQKQIESLRAQSAGGRDTYGWNMELGDLLFLYAVRLALEAPNAPRESSNPAAFGTDAWVLKMQWRTELARFMKTQPAGSAHLEQATAAYRRAEELATGLERRATAQRSLAYVLYAAGDAAAADKERRNAEEVLGSENRLRVRLLYAFDRVQEARVLMESLMMGQGGYR